MKSGDWHLANAEAKLFRKKKTSQYQGTHTSFSRKPFKDKLIDKSNFEESFGGIYNAG